MRISDWSSDVCSSDLDGSKSRAGRHLRKSDASLFRARSGSFEPAVALAGRQGPQQDQQEGRSAPDVWMFPDFLESVASSACAKRIHTSVGSTSSTKRDRKNKRQNTSH